ncbi:MAG: VOC family protein [Actinomycetaceae bacterium]|nr:VOC family protein [Actinomycetaceae bacterium]
MTAASHTRISGNPLWIERYGASEKTEEFYAALFGWEINAPTDDMPLNRPVTHHGRLLTSFEPAIAAEGNDPGFSGWLVSLGVEDVALAAKRAQDGGATIFTPPTPIDDTTSFAAVGVPCGLRIGLLSLPKEEDPTPFEAGFPVWHEAYGGNFSAAVKLFTTAFGWDPQILDPSLEFVTNGPGEQAQVGLSSTTQEFERGSFPVGWEIYFAVANADSACERVRDLGGTLLSEVTDTPWGRIGRCADPDGVGFSVVQL